MRFLPHTNIQTQDVVSFFITSKLLFEKDNTSVRLHWQIVMISSLPCCFDFKSVIVNLQIIYLIFPKKKAHRIPHHQFKLLAINTIELDENICGFAAHLNSLVDITHEISICCIFTVRCTQSLTNSFRGSSSNIYCFHNLNRQLLDDLLPGSHCLTKGLCYSGLCLSSVGRLHNFFKLHQIGHVYSWGAFRECYSLMHGQLVRSAHRSTGLWCICSMDWLLSRRGRSLSNAQEALLH